MTDKAQEFTPEDQAWLDNVLSHGIIFPQQFKDRVAGWILDALRTMPRSQFPGLQLLGVRSAGHMGSSGLQFGPDAGYDSASPAKVVSGLADGNYVVWLCASPTCAADTLYVGISVNGESPSDTYALAGRQTGEQFSAYPRILALSNNDNNSIEIKFRNDGSGGAGVSNFTSILVIRLGPL